MVHRRKKNSVLNWEGFSANGSKSFSNGCEKKREIGLSHLNSGSKNTESAKILLLNCCCVRLADEKTCWHVKKSLCMVDWSLYHTSLKSRLGMCDFHLWAELLVRMWMGNFLLYAEDQVNKQTHQVLKGLSIQCSENPI